jgi:hypothetical protein
MADDAHHPASGDEIAFRSSPVWLVAIALRE